MSTVWQRLLGRDGLDIATRSTGESCVVKLGGVGHEGRVEIVSEGRSVACRLTGLNDALLFIEMEPGSPSWHCGVWLSVYDVPDDRAGLAREGLAALVDPVLAA